jgi:hypothetical protein
MDPARLAELRPLLAEVGVDEADADATPLLTPWTISILAVIRSAKLIAEAVGPQLRTPRTGAETHQIIDTFAIVGRATSR